MSRSKREYRKQASQQSEAMKKVRRQSCIVAAVTIVILLLLAVPIIYLILGESLLASNSEKCMQSAEFNDQDRLDLDACIKACEEDKSGQACDETAEHYWLKDDLQKAQEYYERACEEGVACYMLPRFACWLDIEPCRARCEEGDGEACRFLAWLRDERRNYYLTRTCELTSDLCQDGQRDHCLSRGPMCQDSYGCIVPEVCLASCNKGNALPCYWLSTLYEQGQYAPRDDSKAKLYLTRACQIDPGVSFRCDASRWEKLSKVKQAVQRDEAFVCPDGTSYLSMDTDEGRWARCERPNGTLHGAEYLWSTDGQLVEQRTYVDGEMKTQAHYYQQDLKEWETSYDGGEKHGRETHWYPNGLKQWECDWKEGKKHGSCTYYSDQGEVVRTEQWRDDHKIE